MSSVIDITITEDQFKDDIGEYWYGQLKDAGRVHEFMQSVRDAMLVDYEDELKFFICEFGLE